jgi:hypothetical protein
MNDLRFGLRQFIRKPGVTAVAVATLALGIGATTAIFSVVDHLMLRPLPFDHAERLVTVWQNNHSDGLPRDDVSPANFLDWRERNAAVRRTGNRGILRRAGCATRTRPTLPTGRLG